MKKFFLLFAILFCSAVFGEEPEFVRGEKFKLFPGIEGCEIHREGEKPIAAYIIRIDTSKRGISFYATSPNPNYEVNKKETVRQTAVDFLLENDLAVAINANFYNPFNGETQRTPGDSNVIGAAVSEGIVVSPSEAGRPVFAVTYENECFIREFGPDESLEGIETAVAGSQLLLRNGEIVQTNDTSVHPRTAVGISGEGRYVWFLVIDGRQGKYSVGATFTEIAQILLMFNVDDALNLDGGGSTTLVVAEKKKKGEDGEPYRVINNPVGQGKPGTLRYNANHIGVRIGKKKKASSSKEKEKEKDRNILAE